MLCYQEATYKIIRHRRVGATPTTPHVRQSAQSAFKSQPWLHCRLALFFSHRGRSVTGPLPPPDGVCPAGCANIRNRNMNIPSWGCRLRCPSPSQPSPLSLSITISTRTVFSSLGTNPFHGRTRVSYTRALIYLYKRIGHSRFSSCSEPYLPVEIAKVRAEERSPTSFQ